MASKTGFPLCILPLIFLLQILLAALSVWNIIVLESDFPINYSSTSGQVSAFGESEAVIIWYVILGTVLILSIIAIVGICEPTACSNTEKRDFIWAILLFLSGGTILGFLVAGIELVGQAKTLERQYENVRSALNESIYSAPLACATELASNTDRLYQSPCSACQTTAITGIEFNLDTQVQDELWNSTLFYLTQQIHVDRIICQEDFASWAWPIVSKYSPFANGSAATWPCDPDHVDTRSVGSSLTWKSWLEKRGIELTLIAAYQLALDLFPPIFVNVTSLPTSDCVLINGTASIRYPLAGICGLAGPYQYADPFDRLPLVQEFSNCYSNYLVSFASDYAQHIDALNLTLTHLPLPPNKTLRWKQNASGIYGSSAFLLAICFSGGIVFLAFAISEEVERRNCLCQAQATAKILPTASKNKSTTATATTPLIPSSNTSIQ